MPPPSPLSAARRIPGLREPLPCVAFGLVARLGSRPFPTRTAMAWLPSMAAIFYAACRSPHRVRKEWGTLIFQITPNEAATFLLAI